MEESRKGKQGERREGTERKKDTSGGGKGKVSREKREGLKGGGGEEWRGERSGGGGTERTEAREKISGGGRSGQEHAHIFSHLII